MWQHAIKSSPSTIDAGMLRLWIDGVGAYLISRQSTFTIGGPAETQRTADWSIWGSLAREHLVIRTCDEGFLLEPRSRVRIADREVTAPLFLQHGMILTLGEQEFQNSDGDANVQIEFRQPHPLSLSATLEIVSGHRAVDAADGIVLLHDLCILGRRVSSHIVCRDWTDEVRLSSASDGIRCQAEREFQVNHQPRGRDAIVEAGATVEGDDYRFRLEQAGGP